MKEKDKTKQFYLVDFNILPEAIKKTIRVKEMLHDNEALSINEAVKSAKISRSAYYKYKDHVASAQPGNGLKVMTLVVEMMNHLSPFNRILKLLAAYKADVLAIQRNVPMGKCVMVTIAFSLMGDEEAVASLQEHLKRMKGIKAFKLLGEHRSLNSPEEKSPDQ